MTGIWNMGGKPNATREERQQREADRLAALAQPLVGPMTYLHTVAYRDADDRPVDPHRAEVLDQSRLEFWFKFEIAAGVMWFTADGADYAVMSDKQFNDSLTPVLRRRSYAVNRPEHEACQAGTTGCSIDHNADDGGCEGW